MFISKFFVVLIYYSVCNACDDDIQFHLGTKSPYRFVGNRNHSELLYNGCKPVKLWMVVRHGTRYPSKSIINSMQNELPILRDTILNSKHNLLNSEAIALKKWTPKGDIEEKHLTTEGHREMVELAERMQARFPELLRNIYSSTWYNFKFTKTQRTKASAYYFCVGLFGRPTAKEVDFPVPLSRDPVLRFYKLCDKWRSDVKKNPSALTELANFKKSERVSNMLETIRAKLGFKENYLTYDEVHSMYTTCAFETAWKRESKSPWCKVFDMDTIKVMEDAEDLKYYWIDGYGFNITYKQACILFNDMFSILTDKEPYPKSTVYFTHSGTILKFISQLGLFNDNKPLLHNEMNDTRLWKVGKIDSFGSNLAFVLYDCAVEKCLLVLHNEHVVRLPACPDSDLCSSTKIRQYFKESLDDCAFDEMCGLEPSNK